MYEYFSQGWEAFEQGEAFNSNPYAINSPEGVEWDSGWLAAEVASYQGGCNYAV